MLWYVMYICKALPVATFKNIKRGLWGYGIASHHRLDRDPIGCDARHCWMSWMHEFVIFQLWFGIWDHLGPWNRVESRLKSCCLLVSPFSPSAIAAMPFFVFAWLAVVYAVRQTSSTRLDKSGATLRPSSSVSSSLKIKFWEVATQFRF